MVGWKLKDFKAGFFDRKAVTDAVDKADRKVLSKFGAFVRRAAKSSIRKRKRPSSPGAPPSSHTGLLRNFIFFAWDAVRRSVVIGPALLNSSRRRAEPVAATVPEVLEYGGKVEITRYGNSRAVEIAPRPYMNPAFEAETPKLPEMWRNSVK